MSGEERTDLARQTAALAEECLALLASPADLESEAAVHALRVATKRLRAAWHLVKSLVPSGFARSRRHALARISGRLSESRDRTVLGGLAESLAETAAGEGGEPMSPAASSLKRLAKHLAATPPGATLELAPEEALWTIRKELKAEIEAWRQVSACRTRELKAAVREGIRRSRERARADARLAQKEARAELWHDWRKAVKRLRYQRELLVAMEGRSPGTGDARVSELGTLLGQRNDLANLAAAAVAAHAAGDLNAPDLKRILAVVAKEEAELMERCRQLGRRALLR